MKTSHRFWLAVGITLFLWFTYFAFGVEHTTLYTKKLLSLWYTIVGLYFVLETVYYMVMDKAAGPIGLLFKGIILFNETLDKFK